MMLLGTAPAIGLLWQKPQWQHQQVQRLIVSFLFPFHFFIHRRVHLSRSSQMTPADSSALHWKALITAILTVVALIATTTTKAAQPDNPKADRLPAMPLEMIQLPAAPSTNATQRQPTV